MNPQPIRDRLHRQRLERLRTKVKVLPLLIDHRIDHPQQSVPTLTDRINQPLRVGQVRFQKLPVLLLHPVVHRHPRILDIDLHIGKPTIRQIRKVPIRILVVLHHRIGINPRLHTRRHPAPRRQRQLLQNPKPKIDLIQAQPRLARDFGEPVLHHVLEELTHQLPRHKQTFSAQFRVFPIILPIHPIKPRIDLDQQTLPRIPRPDPHRLKQQLHRLQRHLPVRFTKTTIRNHRLHRFRSRVRNLLKRTPQIPIVIQRGDQLLPKHADLILHIRQRPLIHQLLAHRRPPRRRLRHRLHLRVPIPPARPSPRPNIVILPRPILRSRKHVVRRLRIRIRVLVQPRKVRRTLRHNIKRPITLRTV